MYAVRKRRKPAQKGVKATPADGAKSNPSKRHRDRLNSELDRLASLLPFPEDVISSLDKLSILRLSVSFLRTNNFFSAALKKQLSNGVKRSGDLSDGSDGSAASVPEGALLLQALNGFVLVVTAQGLVFFCSHTIQDYLGFSQTDVMHQSVFELIHTEDQQEFRSNLHWALNPPAGLRAPPAAPPADGEPVSSCLLSYNPDQLPPENSSFLERGFVCRFRCLLDNCSGFLALNIQGRLKFLHGQSRQRCDGEGNAPPQLALFAIATPLQPPAILEIRTRNMIFRTKHKLDFTPMACDAKGKLVLGYTEAELRVRGSGYQFIHAADMLYCAENHVRMMKTGESGLTVFRLLTKDNRWTWVQANARLVYRSGRADYIIATQRPLVDEEGGEHLRKRSVHLPFTFATGEAALYQTGYPLHGFPDSSHGKPKGSKSKRGRRDQSAPHDLDPKSLLGALMSQDESVYVCQPDPEPRGSHSATHGFPGFISDDSWPSNRETGRANSRTSGSDPLLATLDSLCLDAEETCSNSELFSALEDLGLNAEDLELLLLDQRMMQVELGQNHTPTLTDLLTNNEILSYIQDSLEGGGGGAAPPPIVQLSQQMQQSAGASQPGPLDNKVLTPNGHWVVTTENHRHPQTVLKASQLNGEPESSVLESSQWQEEQQEQQEQLLLLQGGSRTSFQPGLHSHRCYIPNGHAAFPPSAAPSSRPLQVMQQVPPSFPAHSSSHSSTHSSSHSSTHSSSHTSSHTSSHSSSHSSALEQILGLSQTPLQAYSVFSSQDAAHSKLENGRLDAAYIRTCLTPSADGAEAAGDVSDGLPVLQDPPKSGFFL